MLRLYSPLTCSIDQRAGFCIIATLAWKGLNLLVALLINKQYLYILVTDFVLSSSTRIDCKKISENVWKKCWTAASQTSITKNFYVVSYWKTDSRKIVFFVVTRRWAGHQSCSSSKVLARVVNIETAASEITKKELVQSQIAEYQCMSFYGIF